MRDQDGLSLGQPEDKALVTATVIIVRQDPRNDTLPLDQNIASAVLDRLYQCLFASSARTNTGDISKIEPG